MKTADSLHFGLVKTVFNSLDNTIKKIIITNDELDYSTSTVIHIKLKDFLLLDSLDNI